MAFITNSVGLGAKNFLQDVKIIQWMLIRAQLFYQRQLFTSQYALTESGNCDTETSAALRDIILIYPNKSLTKIVDSSSLVYDFTPIKPIIFPDDRTYKMLLKYSLKPICVVCTEAGDVKLDFHDDPIAVQALTGRINFQTFKHLAENKDGSLCETLTKEGIEAKNLLKDPRIRAFLDMIAFAEAYFAKRVMNYDEGSNFIKIDDLTDHPQRILPGGSSSASGRYQFMSPDWATTKKAVGVSDFTPESQDIAAVHLLRSRNRIVEAILADNILEAIQRASGTWASFPDKNKSKNGDVNNFPTSHYSGQGAAPANELVNEYLKALNSYKKK
jgi:muramidase (phage lysozyme)